MATATNGWYCRHTATIVENTDTYTKIKVEVFWQNDGHYYQINNVSAWVYCGGQSAQVKNAGSISTTSTTQSVSCGSYTFTINKTTSPQSISCYGKITSNSSYVSGTKSSSSSSVSVSAKTSYTVSYNANGGSGAPSSQTKWYGTNLTLSSTKPTRTGHSFQGWATSSSGGVVYQPGGTYTANAGVTLYAIWKADTYTVSYNANGGSGAPGNQTKTYGVNLTLSSARPTRTNYNFIGWGTSSSATTVSYNPSGTYTANVGITLYAIWQLAYVLPRISNPQAIRCNSDGTETDSGEYLKVKFNWATDKTVSAIGIQWKYAGISAWSDYRTISASGTSGSVNWIGEDGWSTDTSYEVRIYVSDSGGTSYTQSISIGTAKYPIDIKAGGTGVAFGKVSETDDLMDVAFKAQFRQSLNIPQGISGSNIPLAFTVDSYSDFNAMLKSNPTFIGTAYSKGASAWYNIINLRHRNGSGDGTSYGLYLRSLLTSSGNLTWGKQYGSSSWQAERTILDSVNFGDYCAPASHSHSYNCWTASQYHEVGWMGFCSSYGGTRKGWIGHDGTTSFFIKNEAGGSVFLIGSGDKRVEYYGAYIDANWSGGRFSPSQAGTALGGNSDTLRWYRVYSANSDSVSSDERLKHDIIPMNELPVIFDEYGENMLERFFNMLIPSIYYMNNDASNKLRMGFVAQEVVEALDEIDLDENEIDVIDHAFWKDEETGEERDEYSLVYEQFIALNTHMIQKAHKKINEQQEVINNQQQEIDDLKKQVQELKELVFNLMQNKE